MEYRCLLCQIGTLVSRRPFGADSKKRWVPRLDFSTAFHPQTDGQTKRLNQILKDMLRACIMDFTRSWDTKLHLMEFSYNNSFQATIRMAPFEALYGKRCRSPLCWDKVGKRELVGPELVCITNEAVQKIREECVPHRVGKRATPTLGVGI